MFWFFKGSLACKKETQPDPSGGGSLLAVPLHGDPAEHRAREARSPWRGWPRVCAACQLPSLAVFPLTLAWLCLPPAPALVCSVAAPAASRCLRLPPAQAPFPGSAGGVLSPAPNRGQHNGLENSLVLKRAGNPPQQNPNRCNPTSPLTHTLFGPYSSSVRPGIDFPRCRCGGRTQREQVTCPRSHSS